MFPHNFPEATLEIWKDAQGRMLFGCGNAVVAFDGNHWETIPVPGVGFIRGLAADSTGLVWFISSNQIGYLFRADGEWRMVKIHSGSFGFEPQVIVGTNEVYFINETGLLIWSNGKIAEHPWSIDPRSTISLAIAHGRLQIGDLKGSIYELHGDRFDKIAESPANDAGGVRAILDCPIGDALIVRSSGIFQRTGDGSPWPDHSRRFRLHELTARAPLAGEKNAGPGETLHPNSLCTY